ncbi:acyl-CoA reductase-like NAD-dependent aldehyde dehydrogenase [Arthrobacter ginsengisoli]|uniref:Acyl-CoA reductase-like NAD-dependent aldehyde dehydrogenase n=1 Tax=Arthrobacter ginsengisoli TaxID=1356565 RepID=A0ABU1UE30_9MICC|nr:aldehyde dehydrogenase family protein [Arthrobacter ginsengisoli]MDR7083390.1 acyl-CoA reductase-like NAD-dependent aldehyde dehydrogenase [Arthrobacter ginsengisoli]
MTYSDAERLGRDIRTVARIAPFGSEEDANQLGNGIEDGLESCACSRAAPKLLRVAEQSEFCLIGLNAPGSSKAAEPFGVQQSGPFLESGSEVIA